MSREIMQQALDAFEDLKAFATDNGAMPENWDAYYPKQYDALEVLRQALAQPEPVVSFTDNEEGLCISLECNGSYFWQNLSDCDTAKFFVNAYRGRK